MRISVKQQKYIHNYWAEKYPANLVYLFGSRTDDSKKGGDIDILIIGDKICHSDIYKMKFAFCNTFGLQKIDIISLEKNDESAFKKHILSNAVLI